MRFVKSLLGLSCLFGSLNAASARVCPPVQAYAGFTGNVSLDDSAAWNFRAASAAQVSFPGVGGIGVYASFAVGSSVSPSSGSAGADAVAARLVAGASLIPGVSTLPTAAMAWFDTQADYNVSSGASANAGVWSSAMSTIFLDLIEYVDSNNNGKYDGPSSDDTTVQTKYLSSLLWDSICAKIKLPDDPVVVFNMSSIGSLFSVQSSLTEATGVLSNGVVLTPRSMKLDIQISGFPYKGYKGNQNTKLALGAIVASAQANASASASASLSGSSIVSPSSNIWSQLAFTWQDYAVVDDNLVAAVSASSLSTFTNIGVLGWVASLFFAGRAGASVGFQQIYFSFDGTQPSYVYWDPMMVSGPVPPSSSASSFDTVAVVCGAVFGFIGFVLLAFVIYRYCIKKPANAPAQTEPLITDNNVNYTQA